MPNPFQMINPMMNMVNQVRQMQSDPSQISKMLLDRGKIDQKTYEAIQGMNPSQIGNYLMQNGILGQNQINSMLPQANQISRIMK